MLSFGIDGTASGAPKILSVGTQYVLLSHNSLSVESEKTDSGRKTPDAEKK